jgi:hypothetical protein
MPDFWNERKKFEKTGKFILRDWTKKLIVIDLNNAMGEKYHFEIESEADANSVPTRPAGDDTVLNMFFPIASPTPPPEK